MKRFLVLAALSAAVVAWAAGVDRGLVEGETDSHLLDGTVDGGVVLVKGNGTTRLKPAPCSSLTCTRPAPDSGTEGMSLEEVVSWRVMVCAPATQLLTGSGQLEFWTADPATGWWGPMKGAHLNVTENAYQCQSFRVEANDMASAGLRGLYRPNAVGVTGDGGYMTTSMQACKAGSGQMPFRGAGCGP